VERMEVQVRPLESSELAHVYVTWIKSFADSPWAKGMKPTVYEDRQRKLINEILQRPDARLLAACTKDEPDTVFGWACVEGGVVHYVFVKEAFRRLEIAKQILAAMPKGFRFTHRTFTAIPLVRNIPGIVYDPYAAFAPATRAA
jgi:hypothetical protein